MSHGHHNMKLIHPSDTELLRGWKGEIRPMEIYCTEKGTVVFRPSGHPESEPPITLKVDKRSQLPCEAIQVLATGTTAAGLYGIWSFNPNG